MSAAFSLLLCGCKDSRICKADSKSDSAPEKIRVVTKSAVSASTAPSDRTISPTSQVLEPAELDEIDRRVSDLVQELQTEETIQLAVRRIKDNTYEVDGRRVRLLMSSGTGDSSTSVMVQEDWEGKLPPVRLDIYLRQAAFVSSALLGFAAGTAAVARVPADKRLTFASTANADAESIRRVQAMQLACKEARLREEAAQAYASEASANKRAESRTPAASIPEQHLSLDVGVFSLQGDL